MDIKVEFTNKKVGEDIENEPIVIKETVVTENETRTTLSQVRREVTDLEIGIQKMNDLLAEKKELIKKIEGEK